MKKWLYIFACFPVLLFSQEHNFKKPKFYDRIQLIPEFQMGIYEENYTYSSHNSTFELKDNRFCTSIGVSIGFKNPYLFFSFGFFKLTAWNSRHDGNRLQGSIGGNLLFFTAAAKNRSQLYFGPSLVISDLFYTYAGDKVPTNYEKGQLPLIGIGADLSVYNIHIRFSYQYFTGHFKDGEIIEKNNKYILFSIAYGLDLNTFRKKENKRFDL